MAVRPKLPETERPARAAQRQTSKHFSGKVQFDVLAKLLADDRRSAPANEWLRELADPRATFVVETQTHPLLHRAAPDFTLEDHRGQPWRLQGQLDAGPVVLVFYLGYACNACVHDLFELNADLDRFHSLGAEVVAVSADKRRLTRQQFEKYGAFGFPVLSDPGHVVALSYGTFRPAKGPGPEELLHGTFIIARDGQVHWVSHGDTPFRNDKALLYEVARLANKLPQPQPTPGAVGREPKTP
ncbi:MAG TPA: peroxiredoxin family protein [Gemmataceae bacterium]|nr:peroxiredoxin family protein [Gemmataceae bacterium]